MLSTWKDLPVRDISFYRVVLNPVDIFPARHPDLVPEGNVVQTLYLPSVTNTFVQIKSQRLSQIIRVKNLASDYYTGGNAAVGLYIENLTDRMNVSKDTDIIGKYLAANSESI